jgi:hypothetical protein
MVGLRSNDLLRRQPLKLKGAAEVLKEIHS